MQISKKCSIAIHCLVFINEYGNQKKVTSNLLALSCGCNPVTIRNILSSLKKAGIINVPSGTGGATLKKPLAEINLFEICSAVEPDAIDKLMGIHNSPSPLCPVGKNIGSVLRDTYLILQNDFSESLEKITLDTIVEEFHHKLEDNL